MVAGLIVGGILNDLMLSGGFDVPRFDAIYTHITSRAAGPRGPRVKRKLG